MTIRRLARVAVLFASLLLAGCGADPAGGKGADAPVSDATSHTNDRQTLGLMTSLPLYWPLDADFAQIASGNIPSPWGRTVIERRFVISPLDTLSPIAPIGEGDAEIDPLQRLSHIAVIQPRGLSPADNVALDDWVRKGGQLLLVLDPALTGQYDFALGDPRRPTDSALIPPIVARWGLEVSFDEGQSDAPRPVSSEGCGSGYRGNPGSIGRRNRIERTLLFANSANPDHEMQSGQGHRHLAG